MVVMQTRYALIDKDTARVSKLWKTAHIVLLVTAAISGFITGFALSEVNRAFGNNCVIYANIALKPRKTTTISTTTTTTELPPNITNITTTERSKRITHEEHEVLQIDKKKTEWGPYKWCRFCQNTPFVSLIFGLCWVTFFIMCGPGGAGYQSDFLARPWRIVYPALIFSLIFAIVLSVSTIYTSRGLTHFCGDFKERLVLDFYGCSSEINEFTAIFWKGKVQDAYTFTMFAFVFTHVGVIAWWLQCALLIWRVIYVADFTMIVYKQQLPANTSISLVEQETEVQL